MACHLHMVGREADLKTEPCGTPQDSLPGEENSFPTLTENNPFVRCDLKHDIADLENLNGQLKRRDKLTSIVIF